MNDFKILLAEHQTQMLEELRMLVAIASVRDIKSAKEGKPFGEDIHQVIELFSKFASRKGFHVEQFDGYAMHAMLGDGDDYIGVLGHLDVVDAGDKEEWNQDPFTLTKVGNMLYGRGVNDDKGPLLACLYAAYFLKLNGIKLKHPIRIIAGGAEETTWECMDHYFTKNKQPLCGFSPDGDFPIVNAEKGILQGAFQFPYDMNIKIESHERIHYVCDHLCVTLPKGSYLHFVTHADTIEEDTNEIRIEYKGVRSLSRNPQRGENAIYMFVEDFQHYQDGSSSFQQAVHMILSQFQHDHYGKRSNLYAEDDEMGTTSVCLTSFRWDAQCCEVCIDVRYPKSTSEEALIKRLEEIASMYDSAFSLIHRKPLLYVDKDSQLIRALKRAYLSVTGEEAQLITKGGASYARVLKRGVAFGATFPDENPCPHMPNEKMSITSLCKACEIYYEALLALNEEADM